MAQIILTIPDDKIARIRDAYCVEYGYQATLADGTANPETKLAFTKRMIIRQIKITTMNYEANIQANTARNTVNADVESISIT